METKLDLIKLNITINYIPDIIYSFKMRGYKIFGPDYTCRNYKYSLDTVNVCNDPVAPKKSGFHYCPEAIHCLQYYKYVPKNTYAEVECVGKYIREGDKIACGKLRIVKTLTYEEFGKLITFDVCTPTKKCSYVNGLFNGNYTEWYSNGKLKAETTFSHGELNGKYKEWHYNGQLMIDANYINGNLNGEYTKWHYNGVLQMKTAYINGIINGEYNEWYYK